VLVDVLDSKIYSRQEGVHARLHAKYLDKEIGYKVAKIEDRLLRSYRAYDKPVDSSSNKKHYPGTQTWIGLHPQALQTPYNDIHEVFSYLQKYSINKVVDIGAGYGRVGMVMNAMFADSTFTGFEIVKKRQQEANRVFEKYGLNNCHMLNENVLEDEFSLPDADVYFIYDFSELRDISQILNLLSKRLKDKNFFLVTHGDRIDQLLSKKYKEFWITNGHLSFGDLKLYSSNENLNRR
jgi:16S rRNA G527 N7-methylase RsmG